MKAKYNFDKLLTEHDFIEIKKRVEQFDLFEFEKTDKTRKFSVRIYAQACDNVLWQDNYMCSIGCSYNIGGCSSPYQRAEFLALGYEKILDEFCSTLGVERNTDVKQMSLFALM